MAAGKTELPASSKVKNNANDTITKAKFDGPLMSSPKASEDQQQTLHFSIFSLSLTLVSLVSFLADTLTDFLVAIQYFQDGDTTWGALTLSFVFLPSVVIQLFSSRWYVADGQIPAWRNVLIHVFQLQPLERYLYVLVAGMEAWSTRKPEFIEKYYYQQNDVCMLRLFESFLESAPQLTLQVYIILCTHDANWLTGTSACVSLVALGWAVAAYSHALRQAHKDYYQVRWPGLLLQTLWHVSVVAARVGAIVAFTSVFKAWIAVIIGFHWAIMTVWANLQRTDFCPSMWEERLFCMVVGAIYMYCFFSLKEGATRWRIAAFYSVMAVENVIMLGIWFPFRGLQEWHNYMVITVVFLSFFIGMCCMMIYYRFCHPSGPIHLCVDSISTESDNSANSSGFTEPELGPLPKKSSEAQLQLGLAPPRCMSTHQLPRRSLSLLKSQTQMIRFKEIHTPSQLTPIKSPEDEPHVIRRVYDVDASFQLDDTNTYHHYSIDNSACMQASRCATLNFTGIDLSGATMLDRTDPEGVSECQGTSMKEQRLPQETIPEENEQETPCSTPLYYSVICKGQCDTHSEDEVQSDYKNIKVQHNVRGSRDCQNISCHEQEKLLAPNAAHFPSTSSSCILKETSLIRGDNTL